MTDRGNPTPSSAHDGYSSPLAERYASKRMLQNWSANERLGLWRRLWLALAEAERELGVTIPVEALAQMLHETSERHGRSSLTGMDA